MPPPIKGKKIIVVITAPFSKIVVASLLKFSFSEPPNVLKIFWIKKRGVAYVLVCTALSFWNGYVFKIQSAFWAFF